MGYQSGELEEDYLKSFRWEKWENWTSSGYVWSGEIDQFWWFTVNGSKRGEAKIQFQS
jgi:hypothetical protein